MSKHAYIFPGQGSQHTGMGKSLYESDSKAKDLFEQADEILNFRISDIMFSGTEEELKQTNVTQPAVFLHSVVAFLTLPDAHPGMVAGHSLGEFSALVANKTLEFSDALKLVNIRAQAMQKACEQNPSMMAAILGLEDQIVKEICASAQLESGEIVVAANFNCPGQVVISGTEHAINIACKKMLEAGAKRALPLHVGGAFHSPLMEPAKKELAEAILAANFATPICPIYQNVVASAVTDPAQIRQNLIDQLTAPVQWTKSVQAMIANGASRFTEVGPGKVLQMLVKKIDKNVVAEGM